MRRFEGRVVLVTGGSSGIGLETARAFLGEGARVAITARRAGRLEAARRYLARHGDVLAVRGDVSKAGDARRFAARTRRALGPIDVLVNNAGVFLDRPLALTSEREWDRVLDVNLKGTFLCTRAVLPNMLRRRMGAIVNVSSDSGLVGSAGMSAYCASKAGMILMTKALALEVAVRGVRVNAVCPGEVDTPMLRRDMERSGLGPAYLRGVAARIPMRRVAE
ncbi:MAG: hypothetical protein A3K65_04185, partial [Euryarchaeota archaeon RBG_16_68_12]